MVMPPNGENHEKIIKKPHPKMNCTPKIVSNFWGAIQDEDFLFILKLLGLI